MYAGGTRRDGQRNEQSKFTGSSLFTINATQAKQLPMHIAGINHIVDHMTYDYD
jgi:hypothetical protein